jgi:hypothetical protein
MVVGFLPVVVVVVVVVVAVERITGCCGGIITSSPRFRAVARAPLAMAIHLHQLQFKSSRHGVYSTSASFNSRYL